MHTGCCCGEKALWAPGTSPRGPAILRRVFPTSGPCMCSSSAQTLSPALPRLAQLILQLSLRCPLCKEVFSDHSV